MPYGLSEDIIELIEADGWEVSYDEELLPVLTRKTALETLRIESSEIGRWWIRHTRNHIMQVIKAGPDSRFYFATPYAALCALEYTMRQEASHERL